MSKLTDHQMRMIARRAGVRNRTVRNFLLRRLVSGWAQRRIEAAQYELGLR